MSVEEMTVVNRLETKIEKLHEQISSSDKARMDDRHKFRDEMQRNLGKIEEGQQALVESSARTQERLLMLGELHTIVLKQAETIGELRASAKEVDKTHTSITVLAEKVAVVHTLLDVVTTRVDFFEKMGGKSISLVSTAIAMVFSGVTVGILVYVFNRPH